MKNTSVVVAAILILVVGNLFATFVDVVVKALAEDVSIFQYLLLRQVALLLMVFPFWCKYRADYVLPRAVKVYTFRALMTSIGAPAGVVALLHLPLATANVIFYTAPLITLLLAAVIFGEALSRHRVMVTVLGFTGVVIALKPEQAGFASVFALCTASAIAAYNISVKWLPDNTGTLDTLFWSNLLTLLPLGLIAALSWQAISRELIILCISSSVFLAAYQGCCIIAFRKTQAGAIAVAEYSGLIFAAIAGWLLFAEQLDRWTIAGIALIIAPIVWQSRYEQTREHMKKNSLSLQQEQRP